MAYPNKVDYTYIQQKLADLRKNNTHDISSIVMYILNPQLSAFSYDIYDFKKTNVNFETGDIRVYVQDNIKMLISLNDLLGTGQYIGDDDGDEDYKIYVYFNFENLTYELYFKVLNNWELVETVDFKIPANADEKVIQETRQRQNNKFIRFSKYINGTNIRTEFKNNREKFFTEAVLNRYLDSQEFNNEFIRTALLNEFKKPSNELITMLASALGKEFTTMPIEKVQEKLQPLTVKGLYEAVESLINGTFSTQATSTTASKEISNEDFSFLQNAPEVKQELKVEVKKDPFKALEEDIKKDTNKETKKQKEVKQVTIKELDREKEVKQEPVKQVIPEKDVRSGGVLSLDGLLDDE